MAITVKIKSDFSYSYCSSLNHVPFIEEIRVRNNGKESVSGLSFKLTASPAFFQEHELDIPEVKADGECVIAKVNLKYDTGLLANYAETVKGTLTCQLLKDGKEICKDDYAIELSPYDEMSNYKDAEMLRAAFVMPNHSAVTKMVTRVSEIKGKKYGSYSIVGYASGKEDVLKTAEAVYEAIRENEISYVISKTGFSSGKQRVRLVDEVLREKQGNCMDLTCLFASVFEAVGLSPLIAVLPNHAFVGLWTSDKRLNQAVVTQKDILQHISKEDLVLIECTLAVKGQNVSYQNAVKYAQDNYLNRDDLESLLDIKNARDEGVLPLPSRAVDTVTVETDTMAELTAPYDYSDFEEEYWEPLDEEDDQIDEATADSAEEQTVEPIVEQTSDDSQSSDKIARWKNKLLDLSARSDLLNIKISADGKRAVSILSSDTYTLYEKIKTEEAFDVNGTSEDVDEPDSPEKKVLQTDRSDSSTKDILSFMRNKDNEFRTQKGANIFYMTFGTLRWREIKSDKWYDAPLLMVPMTIHKEGSSFKIAYDGSDIYLNAAVLEMLKMRFDMQLSELVPTPLGKDGHPDYSCIIEKLRAAVADNPSLEVHEDIHLGIFAFSQYLMWNDLDKNQELFLAHPIVHSIEQGYLDTAINSDVCEVDEKDVFLPIPADGTQIKAITTALGNQSFVLHGPPGTGKSQTITNMLANFIGHDRNVLFAAEKAAALQVVYNRMKGIGLEQFCLYLPVDSVSKSSLERFLTQYRELMELPEEEETKYEEICKKIDAEKELISEQLALYTEVKFGGYTLQKLVENVLKNKNRMQSVSEVSDILMENIRKEDVTALQEQLMDAIHMGNLAGGAKDHPLKNWGTFEYKFGMQKELRGLLRDYMEALESIEAYQRELLTSMIPEDELEANSETIDAAYCDMLLHALEIAESIRVKDDLLIKVNIWIKWLEVQAQRNEICKDIDEEILTHDFIRMANKWKAIKASTTAMASYEKLLFKNSISQYCKKANPSDKDITDMFVKALKLYEITKDVPDALDFSLPLNIEEAKELRLFLEADFPNGMPPLTKVCKEEHREALLKLQSAFKNCEQSVTGISAYLGKNITVWNTENSVGEALKDAKLWLEGIDKLREWHDYQKLKKLCTELGMGPWITLYENGEDEKQLMDDFVTCCSEAMLQEVFKTNEKVKEFAGFRFDNLVEKYNGLMSSFYEICGKEIRCRHLKRIQEVLADPSYEKDKVVLKKIIESGGKGVTIRDIIARVGGFILKLTPCVMATPMTTSMYFPIEAVVFDHMILDEASQLQTCKSVGLIVRSAHSIIVGDPNQMPPTSFFESSTPDYNLDVQKEDQESILKDFIALDMPDYYLKWHYRSNHESLIAFSNNSYYKGRMITFPSADKTSKVSVVRTNGIYDRGNSITNPIEAQTLVDTLESMLISGDTRSFGVIAFNKRQQTLIEQLIEKKCEESPEFASLLSEMEGRGEELFVRNLENVQGDERDVILFSIGFGPDEDGKIIMSFGPLAKAGGWRRLNVAITRSRDEMILFTSMDSEQMKVSDSTSRGVKDLKDFIAYAEGKDILQKEEVSVSAEQEADGFAEAVCQYLEECGYKYTRNIGNSALTIDIGVIDPEDEDRYLLGIMLDSSAITKAFTIYDSEIGQSKILRSYDWNLLRLWSLDWFEDCEREKKRILDKIKR